MGSSRESLPTDPGFNRATTAELDQVKDDAPTRSVKRKPGHGVPIRAKSVKTDHEVEQSPAPPNPKALPASEKKAGSTGLPANKPLRLQPPASVKAPDPAKEEKETDTKNDETSKTSKDSKPKKSKAKAKAKAISKDAEKNGSKAKDKEGKKDKATTKEKGDKDKGKAKKDHDETEDSEHAEEKEEPTTEVAKDKGKK